MYQLVFYVPETHAEPVKEALFEAGAGRIGDYEYCAWQVSGQGQFRPLASSRPFLGSEGRLERVPEYRVEMVCGDDRIEAALAALVTAHPYEEPAFHYWVVNAKRPA